MPKPFALKKIILTATFFLGVLLQFASAQSSSIGAWYIYFGNKVLDKRWNLHHEIQYRNYNLAGDLEQLLLRTGVGYNLSENNNNLLLGYGFIHGQRYGVNTDEKLKSNEHRIFQQFISRQHFGRVYVQHRYRIEERFLKDDFKWRCRYFLSLNVPINHAALLPGVFYVSAYNEIFLQPKSAVFDRNRIYGALGYVINKNLKAEGGFMTQLYENTNRGQFQLVVFNTIPFLKKED